MLAANMQMKMSMTYNHRALFASGIIRFDGGLIFKRLRIFQCHGECDNTRGHALLTLYENDEYLHTLSAGMESRHTRTRF